MDWMGQTNVEEPTHGSALLAQFTYFFDGLLGAGGGERLIVSTIWVLGRLCACFTVVNSPVEAFLPIFWIAMAMDFLPEGRYTTQPIYLLPLSMHIDARAKCPGSFQQPKKALDTNLPRLGAALLSSYI
jgi:hypothetical protein